MLQSEQQRLFAGWKLMGYVRVVGRNTRPKKRKTSVCGGINMVPLY